MSLYKHMKQLAAARDDESRPLAERVAAAEVLETTCRIVYERAQAKAKELKEQQMQGGKKQADFFVSATTLLSRHEHPFPSNS